MTQIAYSGLFWTQFRVSHDLLTDLTAGKATVRTFLPRFLTAASRIQNCTYRKIIRYQTPQSNFKSNQIKSFLLLYETSKNIQKQIALYNILGCSIFHNLQQQNDRQFIKQRGRKTLLGLWAPKLLHKQMFICKTTPRWRTCYHSVRVYAINHYTTFLQSISVDESD